ncbi:MAG: hypothetical protein L0287_01410, partial [Anaerolineae bacterium]|nr:hypothetical protein [Anaerolineae bacterium]
MENDSIKAIHSLKFPLAVITINQGSSLAKERVAMKRYTIVFLFMLLVAGLVYSSSARVQNKTKRTISEIHFHSKEITPPVKFSNLKIRNKRSEFSSMFEEKNRRLEKPVDPRTEFEEDDDFWEHISFDVTNVSDKTITYLKTLIYLYTREELQSLRDTDGDTGGRNMESAAIEFGVPFKVDPPYLESLEPGQTKTFAVSQIQIHLLNYARNKVLQLPSPIVRVGIYAMVVQFSDGYSWTYDGKIFPPESKEKQSNIKNQVGRKIDMLNASANA